MFAKVSDAPHLKGVTVLVRSSLNVPVENGVVTNPFRLERALLTINFLKEKGARVVLLSHIDGPKGSSLAPVYKELRKKMQLTFIDDVAGERAHAAARGLQDGQVLMLENVRRDAGEELNDDGFARRLASLAQVFVNDDFATSHRKHASIISVPKYVPSYAGVQFVAEVEGLTRALTPKSPSLALIGGAKFVTKEPLVRKLLTEYDHVFIGGALANDIFKAKGYEVGKSLVSDPSHVKDLLTNSKILIPTDVTVGTVDGREVRKPDDVHENDVIYDHGPETLKMLKPLIAKAKTVVWNGPLGNFEKGCREITEGLAQIIAAAPGTTIVGGGDTIASIQNLNITDKFTFVSTSGGAMLDFLANDTLPGIEALENTKRF